MYRKLKYYSSRKINVVGFTIGFQNLGFVLFDGFSIRKYAKDWDALNNLMRLRSCRKIWVRMTGVKFLIEQCFGKL